MKKVRNNHPQNFRSSWGEGSNENAVNNESIRLEVVAGLGKKTRRPTEATLRCRVDAEAWEGRWRRLSKKSPVKTSAEKKIGNSAHTLNGWS